MRIAISVITHAGQSVWSNGIGQNTFHLATALDALPMVESVVLIDCGDQRAHAPDTPAAAGRFPLVDAAGADSCDVVIEMGGALDPNWLAAFRARGGRAVFMVCGQPHAALIEPTLFDRPAYFGPHDRCDAVWILPKDRPFAAMLRTVHRCPVAVVPYLWSPVFAEEAARALQAAGLPYGYQPGSLAGGLRAASFEPNVSAIKMGVIPMLIAEGAYRSRPDAIARFEYLNGLHMVEQASFNFMVQRTGLHRDGRLTIHAREVFAHFMASRANCVISHQTDCDQNYLYLDALHAGYPLVHNSPAFAHLGYYYPGNDCAAGTAALLRAADCHDADLPAYRAAAHAEFARLDPLARASADAYARALLALGTRK